MPKRKRSREGFPYDATPDVHHFPGVPRSSFDLVNMYGTYNIQPTSDTENTFPLIAPGLPKAYRNMKLDKHDLEPLTAESRMARARHAAFPYCYDEFPKKTQHCPGKIRKDLII